MTRARIANRVLRVPALAVCFAASVSCHPGASVTGLSPKESARRITQLRNEADACLERFKQSRGVALEELECFTEKQYLTTQLQGATDCPLCYLNYGWGLRLLGDYHRTRLEKIEEMLADASAAEAGALESKASEAREVVEEYFSRSIEMFELYIRTPGRHISDSFLWLSDNSQFLGDYEKAARYLDDYLRLLGNDLPPAERQRLERDLRRYRTLRDQGRVERAGP